MIESSFLWFREKLFTKRNNEEYLIVRNNVFIKLGLAHGHFDG